MPDPIGQGGPFDIDALARQDRRLAIERQAVEILADHHIGDETGTGATLLDRQVGCRRLHDPFAGAAAQLGPDMADHLEPRRDLLQYLGHVLAQFGEVGAAAAGANRARMMHDLLTQQVIGQRAAHRLTPFPARPIRLALCRRRHADRRAFLQILQHQLELLDLGVELLR